jgi:ABC-type thiamine transport system ATPase subunit
MDKLVAKVVQRYKAASISHEAQRAFDLELKKGLSEDVSNTLQKAIEPVMEKLADLEDGQKVDGAFTYAVMRYKPMTMMQEEFAKQLGEALREWYRPLFKAIEGR